MSRLFETPLYPYQRSPDQDAAAPVHHPVVIVGAGPVGLALAIDLAMKDVAVVVVDENDKVSFGSRAICFAKKTLEILDQLGCGDPMVNKGVIWNTGKVFFDERKVFEFNLLAEKGHKRPAFINLQQYYLEFHLVERIRQLQAEGKSISLRGGSKVVSVESNASSNAVTIATPDGEYNLVCDWLIACDGANSPIRTMMGLDFVGRVFEDNFLIADIKMTEDVDFPVERRFWFDPPFNRGQSALLHKQPDNVWRIDLQLGWDIDKREQSKPENVIPRIKAFLGDDLKFDLEWVSIYTFQCRRMEKFRHNRLVFAGDSAHQVSPFGARGANSGIQDAHNLGWKLKLVLDDLAPESLIDTYDQERLYAADENILNSSRSTDFITPKSEVSRLFRDAVLDLSELYPATRPMVNSGRLSVPCVYDGSVLNGADPAPLPAATRPGAPCLDAPLGDDWLLDRLDGRFHLLVAGIDPASMPVLDKGSINVIALPMEGENGVWTKNRYLGDADQAIYLIRPDQHVAARWVDFDEAAVLSALNKAMGK